MPNRKHQVRIYYYLDSSEAEVFHFLKRQKALNDLPRAMANFYLPHARLRQSEDVMSNQFEEAYLNFQELTKAHLKSQQQDLLKLENLDNCLSKKNIPKHDRSSTTIKFDSNELSLNDEIERYFLSFSAKEISKKIKKFAVGWYLFIVRYQARKNYSYNELKFTFERGKNWIVNETNYLKSFEKAHQKLNINEVIEVVEEEKIKQKKDLFF